MGLKVKNPRKPRPNGEIIKEAIMANETKNETKEEAKIHLVEGVRRNALKPGLFYITVSGKKVLATRDAKHFEQAVKWMVAKTPVAFREEMKDGKAWLIEMKAVEVK